MELFLMKPLCSYLGSMYPVTGFILLLCAAVSSYAVKAFPANLLVAIAACALLDLAVKKLFLRKELRFPSSAVITGIIIGSIAPLNAPVIAILAAAAVAIISKYLIRVKGRHIFNPATLGLLAALSLFRLGDVWWGASFIVWVAGFAVPLTLLLIVANYQAGKLSASVPFLVATAILYAATQLIAVPFTAAGLLTFFSSLPFYFAFVMLSEPKTSPNAHREQVVFGVSVAVLVFALEQAHVKYPFFIALLLGNVGYAIYRNRTQALAAKQTRR